MKNKSILSVLLAAQLTSLGALAEVPSALVPKDPPANMTLRSNLIPNPDLSKAPVNDPYFGFQWGLLNNGQAFVPKLDDLHLDEKILSNPKIQIGWRNFDAEMKRDAIVAVMDSGVFTSEGHEDLGEDILLPGKNYTDADAEIYDDLLGHGTHIAGIIAAKMNNGIGISGMSNKIKILPLKVYDESRNRKEDDDVIGDDDSTSSNLITPKIIKAIDDAIEQKADVIQLSLGWPRAEDYREVHQAFKKAYDAGIIIVAASGNDGHDAQIFPCAYKEVLCVGAISMDGKLAPFSNYGGHVDLLAPGQGILSTIPPTLMSFVFGPRGYEIKNGTSQAAPFVSGAAAILKAIYPNESADQIRNRLLLGSEKISPDVSFGLLNIAKSVSLTSTGMARALIKEIEDAAVDVNTRTFQFPVIVYNSTGQPAAPKVQSLESGIQIVSTVQTKVAGAETQYLVTAKVDSLKRNHHFSYSVDVKGRVQKGSLVLKAGLNSLQPVIYPLTRTDAVKETGLVSVSSPRPTSAVRYWSFLKKKEESKLELIVWTLENGQLKDRSIVLDDIEQPWDGFNLIADDFDFDGRPDYLFAGVTTADGKEKLEFFYLNQDMKLVYRFPVDFDVTTPDYVRIKDMALSKMTLPNGKALKIPVPVFWNRGESPRLDTRNRFDSEADRKKAGIGSVSSEDTIASRGLPATEENPEINRIYYYEPRVVSGAVRMVTRALTGTIPEQALGRIMYENKVRAIMNKPAIKALISDADLKKALDQDTFPFLLSKPAVRKQLTEAEVKEVLDTGVQKDLKIFGLLPQTNADAAKGSFDLLVSQGRGILVQLYRITISDLSQRFQGAKITALPKQDVDLDRHQVQDVTYLGRPGSIDFEAGFSTIYSFTSARSLVLRGNKIGGTKLEIPRAQEGLTGVLKTYTTDTDILAFADTTRYMRAMGKWNGKAVDAKTPIYRSTFLPSYSYSQSFESVLVSKDRQPGVMIDNSQIFSNSAMIYTIESNGQMESSIERSIDIPRNCQMRRQPLMNEQQFSRLAFVCVEQGADKKPTGKIDLRIIDLK